MLHIPMLQEQLQGIIVIVFPQVSLPGLTCISLGLQNTPGDIDALLQLLGKIARQPRASDENPFAPKQSDIKP